MTQHQSNKCADAVPAMVAESRSVGNTRLNNMVQASGGTALAFAQRPISCWQRVNSPAEE